MKAILFDVDGVLVDSEAFIAEAGAKMFSELYGADVDPSEFTPRYLRWEATEGGEIGQGGADGPDGTDLLQHGTVQVRRGVPPDWKRQWVTMPLFLAIDAAADEQGPGQVPERE